MRIKDMLFCDIGKDGGPESKVFGFWFIRIKSLFTVALLRFDEGSREAFHSHAFNSLSFVLKGKLEEHVWDGDEPNVYTVFSGPIITRRSTLHKVYGRAKHTWVLTFRGPWKDTWHEYVPGRGLVTLTHDRVEVSVEATN